MGRSSSGGLPKARGTWELKPVNVDRDMYRTKLVKDLFPAITSKWPSRRSPIYVQQDGAPAHVKEADMEVVFNENRYSWDINLHTPPPNSPDFNVLDMGLFRAIQSTAWDKDITNVRDIAKTAKRAFDNLDPHTLNDTFLSLQKTYGV